MRDLLHNRFVRVKKILMVMMQHTKKKEKKKMKIKCATTIELINCKLQG